MLQSNQGSVSISQKKTRKPHVKKTEIEIEDQKLLECFEKALVYNENFTRKLVSFQANKGKSKFRLYKFKEAFSFDLISNILKSYDFKKGIILDPFSGSGTALFTSSALGFDADGIELLPIGQKIYEAGKIIRKDGFKKQVHILEEWKKNKPWNQSKGRKEINTLRITDGAYPKSTEVKIARFLYELEQVSAATKKILFFALLSILEVISYTRKDGQYLGPGIILLIPFIDKVEIISTKNSDSHELKIKTYN